MAAMSLVWKTTGTPRLDATVERKAASASTIAARSRDSAYSRSTCPAGRNPQRSRSNPCEERPDESTHDEAEQSHRDTLAPRGTDAKPPPDQAEVTIDRPAR